MSQTNQQSKASATTTNVTDSYNVTKTTNRIFDNAGNTNVYFNSDKQASESGSSGGIDNKTIAIAAGVIGAALLLYKGKE